jgi:hypothetical protein
MAVTAAGILIAGTALAVAGAGVGAYGQYQAGKTQQAIAQYNAQQQERQAAMQLQATEVANAIQRRTTEANFLLRSAEVQARKQNARQIEKTALNQDAINRENLRKRLEAYDRMRGEQRAQIAQSGVAESSGTPLDLIADTVAKIQMDMEEQHYIGEVNRRTLFTEAARERLGGKLGAVGATMERESGLAEASLREAAARGEYLGELRGAEITRLTGKAAAKSGMLQAGATLLSGLGTAASGVAGFYGPPKTTATPTYRVS